MTVHKFIRKLLKLKGLFVKREKGDDRKYSNNLAIDLGACMLHALRIARLDTPGLLNHGMIRARRFDQTPSAVSYAIQRGKR